MNIGYIKKGVISYCNIADRVKCFLGVISISKFEQGYVIKLPSLDKNNDKIIQNLLKIIKKLKLDAVVFSDNISNDKIYSKIKQKIDIDILDGRRLMKYLDYDIFKYILNLQKTEIRGEDIYFLIKKDDNLDLQFLDRFIQNCKIVNIVTNDIERFKKIQNNLYEKENILIGVSNNKTKSLKRAKYIFNINMGKKDLEKFKINRNAIIVNFSDYLQYSSNVFDGININYFHINIPDEYIEKFEYINECEDFDNTKIYEALLMKKIECEKKKITILSKSDLEKRRYLPQNIIYKDGIKLMGLVGNNGRIDECEIIQNYKRVI